MNRAFYPQQSELTRQQLEELILSRHWQEGETAVDRVCISNRLHSIGDQLIIRKFNPDITCVGTIVDLYYIGEFDYRVIVRRKTGCNVLWYRCGLHHCHTSDVISDSVR